MIERRILRPTSKQKIFLANVALVVAYVASGKLGLLLALPPGYASAIFPPAGIAVAAALIGGARLLPGVFVGALLLNLWVGYSESQYLSVTGGVVAGAIALASVLQCAMGAWLLRSMIGYPAPFDNGRNIWTFLLAVPGICLISASISVTALFAAGFLTGSEFLTNWATWWMGDTIGLLVLFPITMSISGEPRDLWRRRLRVVAFPMILAFAVITAIYIRINHWERQEMLLDFRRASEQLADKIRTELDAQVIVLEQVERFMSRPQHVTREEYRYFLERIFARYPNVQALAWDPRVTSPERLGHERAQQGEVPGFEIRERTASGTLVRAGDRHEYFPVTYIEPKVGNEDALGYDIASAADRRTAIDQALSSKVAKVTRPIRLVQVTGHHAGLLIVMPVFEAQVKKGVIACVLRISAFLDKLHSPVRSQLHVRFTDVAAGEPLYDSFGSGVAHIYRERIDFAGREYELQTHPTAAYLSEHRGWQSWSVLVAGLTGVGLLGALLLLGSGYTMRLERSEERFRATVSAAPTAMVMIDSEGIIQLTNKEAERLFGYETSELIGRSVETLIPHRFREAHPALRGEFFTRPETRRMGTGRELFGVRKDTSEFPIEIGLSPIRIDKGLLVLSAIVDITERKLAERERESLLEQLRMLNVGLEERVQVRTAELGSALKEREVLLQEIHHRVKNNLQVISSLINMQIRKLEDGGSRDALKECQTRVQAIALIHEKLYQSEDYARIPFPEYIRSLAVSVFQATGVSPTTVELELAIEDVALPVDKAIPCGLILNELITNALKHGFPNDRQGLLRVEFGQVSATQLAIVVEDNGVGVSPTIGGRVTASLGMQLVNTLTAQLGGQVTLMSQNGTRFVITFPS